MLLNGIFNHALKRGWCKHNPVTMLDKPRNPRNPDIRFLTLPEVEAILAATPPTELGRIDRLVYLTAVMTGMRRGEVVAIRWQDIDWDTRVIRVRRNYTRRRIRNTQITPLKPRRPARRPTRHRASKHYELTTNHDALDLVFTNPVSGTVLDPSKLRRRFVACALQAGVRPVRFHDLRHTFGTHMAAAGAPLRAVQEWLGHTDYRTNLIYADYALDPHQGARYAELAFGAT